MTDFKDTIHNIVIEDFGSESGNLILQISDLIKYITVKTKSANESSKSRGSFGNLYAIYVLVEDYLKHGFDTNEQYKNYEGAMFSSLLTRQRQLPFGAKLQNHALNHRMNMEFKKICSTCEFTPIIRDATTNRYWFNENLLKISIGGGYVCIAKTIIKIIDAYIATKQNAFNQFIDACEKLKSLESQNEDKIVAFIMELIKPEMDARIFEIVSFAILKYHYFGIKLFWGFTRENLKHENLVLYKTGRTNANDGGIDFVMKPLGRFFQVTETLDIKKYFLDIDKIEKYPLSFVVKTEMDIEDIRKAFLADAIKLYCIQSVVESYMNSIEEIINIPILKSYLISAIEAGHLEEILSEIILQSKVEFNYNAELNSDDETDD